MAQEMEQALYAGDLYLASIIGTTQYLVVPEYNWELQLSTSQQGVAPKTKSYT